MAWARALALSLTGTTLAALVGAVGLAVHWSGVDTVRVATTFVLVLPGALVGVVVGRRRPTNPVGALISLQAAVFAVIFGWQGSYDEVVQAHPGVLPVWSQFAVLERGSWTLLFLPVALLLLVFPDGRPPGRGWRWVAAGLVTAAVSFLAIASVSPRPLPAPYQTLPHPFGTAPLLLQAVGWALLPAYLALLVASAVALAHRYRRSEDRVVRAQIRWLALGAWALPGSLVLCWAGLLLWGRPDLVVVGLALLVVAVPISIAVAMLRHDLYDVDRAFSATATYSLLSVMLLAVYTVVAALAGTVFGRHSTVVAALVTAIAAIALAPIRRVTQRVVDRRLYPTRAALRSGLADLRSGIDEGTAEPEHIETVLRRALGAPHLRVGYLAPGDDVPCDRQGKPVAEVVPIRLAGHLVGALDPGETRASRELLGEAAAASAMAVEVARLRQGMARTLSEIRQSRSRIQRHGDEERRRLQRDLHDGAQQRLVALGMSLRIAQRHLQDAGFDIDAVLDQAMVQLGTAVAELRTLAAGLRPPGLDGGLGTALRSLAASVPIPIDLSIDDAQVPDDIATTAYYVVSEGLANVIKHSRAEQVGITLARRNGQLRVEVYDNGIGGVRPGSGLAGLADRVAAAGGELRVISPKQAGTRLEVLLPCGS